MPEVKRGMFTTELDDVIVRIVDGILEHVEIPTDRGLYIRARIRVKKPERTSKGKMGFLHFVFQRPYTSATSVWFQAGDDRGFIPDDALWKNTSNHDSCWRSDGVRSPIVKAYFDYCKKVAPKMAPIDLEATADIDRVSIVKIETQRESDGYHRQLVKMARWSMGSGDHFGAEAEAEANVLYAEERMSEELKRLDRERCNGMRREEAYQKGVLTLRGRRLFVFTGESQAAFDSEHYQLATDKDIRCDPLVKRLLQEIEELKRLIPACHPCPRCGVECFSGAEEVCDMCNLAILTAELGEESLAGAALQAALARKSI